MKRTALKRKTPIAKTNRKRAARKKAADFGPQARVCRLRPCDGCGAPPPSDPHHVRSRGAGGSDEHCVSLCRPCHIEIHAVGCDTFGRKRDVDLRAVAARISREVMGA